MGFLKSYAASHLKEAAAFMLFSAVFGAAIGLYGLPMAAFLYPFSVCCVLGTVIFVSGYFSGREKHRILESMKDMPAELIDVLPAPSLWQERDYIEIVMSLKKGYAELSKADKASRRDMADYYTMWAHQIKLPISSMRLELQGSDSSFSRRLASELKRIEQYVEMVLAFVRLDSCSSDYLFARVPLDRIIKEAVKGLAGQFIGKKIRLEYEPACCFVLTDEKWLSFVVEQVLSNSLKYTPEGGCVRIYTETPLTLCISDSGIGIAPEDLPRIFQKSYTGYNGRADKKASGIGLYLCSRICQKLGHGIKAESEPGRGTVVKIDLFHEQEASE